MRSERRSADSPLLAYAGALNARRFTAATRRRACGVFASWSRGLCRRAEQVMRPSLPMPIDCKGARRCSVAASRARLCALNAPMTRSSAAAGRLGARGSIASWLRGLVDALTRAWSRSFASVMPIDREGSGCRRVAVSALCVCALSTFRPGSDSAGESPVLASICALSSMSSEGGCDAC